MIHSNSSFVPICIRYNVPMVSLLAAALEVLQERGPSEVLDLAARALALRQARGRSALRRGNSGSKPRKADVFALVHTILEYAKREEYGLRIIEYPSYRLKCNIPKTPARGLYLRFALEALAESPGPVRLDELTVRYSQRHRCSAIVPEFWMFAQLHTEGQRTISKVGVLRVGVALKALAPSASIRGRHRVPSAGMTGVEPLHAKIYEENLESLILERLDEIEAGLTLVQRQYVTPVGRIDVLCRDRKGNLVVIELKRFRGSTESIIDQITRYIGWVEEHLARPPRAVRGYIIVGKLDRKLEYSVRAIGKLRVKCFRVLLSDPD